MRIDTGDNAPVSPCVGLSSIPNTPKTEDAGNWWRRGGEWTRKHDTSRTRLTYVLWREYVRHLDDLLAPLCSPSSVRDSSMLGSPVSCLLTSDAVGRKKLQGLATLRKRAQVVANSRDLNKTVSHYPHTHLISSSCVVPNLILTTPKTADAGKWWARLGWTQKT